MYASIARVATGYHLQSDFLMTQAQWELTYLTGVQVMDSVCPICSSNNGWIGEPCGTTTTTLHLQPAHYFVLVANTFTSCYHRVHCSPTHVTSGSHKLLLGFWLHPAKPVDLFPKRHHPSESCQNLQRFSLQTVSHGKTSAANENRSVRWGLCSIMYNP